MTNERGVLRVFRKLNNQRGVLRFVTNEKRVLTNERGVLRVLTNERRVLKVMNNESCASLAPAAPPE